jgi:hypothetical protein
MERSSGPSMHDSLLAPVSRMCSVNAGQKMKTLGAVHPEGSDRKKSSTPY